MDELWYVHLDGQSRQCTSADARTWFDEGQLDGDSLVWKPGLATWCRYRDSSLGSPLQTLPMARPIEPPPPRLPDGRIEPTFGPMDLAKVERPPTLAPPADAPPLPVCDDGWQDASARPWRRYFARTFDVVVLGLLGWFTIGTVSGTATPGFYSAVLVKVSTHPFISSVLTYLMLIPVLAVCTGLSGSSPGKWIFGVRVLRASGEVLGVDAALRREWSVFARGLAFGLPIFTLAAQIVALATLSGKRKTSWDDDGGWVVTHRPLGLWQAVLFVVGGMAIPMAFALVKGLS